MMADSLPDEDRAERAETSAEREVGHPEPVHAPIVTRKFLRRKSLHLVGASQVSGCRDRT